MQNEKLEGVVCKNQRKKHKQRETRDKSVAGTIEKWLEIASFIISSIDLVLYTMIS